MLLQRRGEAIWSIAVLSVAFALTFGFCVFFSRHRILWSDELFGWMLLRDPSFSHMLTAWRAGADGGGLLFYLLGRLWFACFGPSELSFRLFSAAGIYVGFVATWLALRRRFDPLVGASVLLLVWFATFPTLLHMIEGRFYGMLLGATALAFLGAVLTNSTERVSPSLLLYLFFANLLLTGTHPLGIVYSAALLCSIVCADLLRRRFRPWPLIAVATGWSVLLFSREAMRNTAAVGKPHFWTTRPHVRDLQFAYQLGTPIIGKVLYLSLAVIVVAVVSRRLRKTNIRAQAAKHGAVYLPALSLLLVPVLLWIVSRRGTSIFVDRYLLPLDIGIAALLAETWSFALIAPRWRPLIRRTGCALLALVCVAGVAHRLQHYGALIIWPPADFTGELLERLPAGLPVVIERADVLDLMLANQRGAKVPMFYLLDWDTAMAPESPRGDVSGFHEMQNWRRLGYFSGSIQNSDDFLRTTSDFVVVDDAHEKWFERRIQSDPHWSATSLGVFEPQVGGPVGRLEWKATIWKVHRLS